MEKYLAHAILAESAVVADADRRGLHGEPLEFCTDSPLAIAYSRVRNPPESPDIQDLLAHARVVERLFQHNTVIPLRYGCWFPGPPQLVRVLHRNQSALRDCLDQVGDCVEMGIRVLPSSSGWRVMPLVGDLPPATPPPERARGAPASPSAPVTSANPGASYLRSRKSQLESKDQQQQARDHVQRRLEQAFAGLFRQSLSEQQATKKGSSWSVCFLVPRSDRPRFRAIFRQLEQEWPDRILLTGPWPPYNFVARTTSKLI